jgi:hypothetical protein
MEPAQPQCGPTFFQRRMSPLLARCGDDRRPSWRPLIEVVLPPLWHHGLPQGSNDLRTAQRAPRSGGRADEPRTRPQRPTPFTSWSMPILPSSIVTGLPF